MADNSEIIVGGGQAVKPDQATIDALVEKLKEKLMAREMVQERIDALLAKYRESLPKWLTLTHKYITLYPKPTGNADYNRDYATIYTDESVFEEVNWSAVDYPEERPDEYRFSRRLSNMYHYTDDPDYKFPDVNTSIEEEELHWTFNEETGEYEQVPRTMIYKADAAGIIDRYDQSTSFRLATYNHNDDIRKIFFLEIVWGYSGWEWRDYERVIGTDPETEEPITEILKGGNLYLIKDIETVASIIDGHRLQHINDFLNTQLKVNRVEGFNTVNLIAANRAFKRGSATSTGYPKRHWNDILECHFVDGYNRQGQFVAHPFGYQDTLSELLEADGLFYNNKVYMYEGDFTNVIPFTIPNIINIDSLYAFGAYTDNLKFSMPSLKQLTKAFYFAIFPQDTVDLNAIFVNGTLNNIESFDSFLAGVSITGYETVVTDKVATVKLDLTSSNVDSDTVINLTRFVDFIGPKEYGENAANNYNIQANTRLSVDLKFNKKVKFEAAFANILRNKNTTFNGTSVRNGGFEKLIINLNNGESYITSIKSGLANNTFVETPDILQVPNNACDDSYIYQGCTFNIPMSYNFLNGSIASPREQGYGQFNNCTFNDTFDFDPDNSHSIQGLDRVEFCGIKFGNDVPAADRAFPYVVQNQNDTTYRYFDVCNSMFTSIPAQNIYIDTMRMLNAEDRYAGLQTQGNPFYGCSQFTDLSNIHLYYKSYSDNGGHSYDYTRCTSMTKTPHIHLTDTSSYAYNRFNFGDTSRSCTNLTEINMEYFENTGSGGATGNGWISCINCTSLVYFKVGTQTSGWKIGSINLTGCFNLDVTTLAASLDKLYTLGMQQQGFITLQGTIWDELVSRYPNTANHCIALGIVNDIR